MAHLLQVEDLARQFRLNGKGVIDAVKGITFHINTGEVYSLLGPNGAGKSTTIAMISGLIEPTRGQAIIDGHSIQREPLQAKQLLGVVPQDIALYPRLSARQNLEFFGRMYGLTGSALARRTDDVLDIIELAERQHDKVETFSGGMKRRVNIGVGLIHQPRLIYMDEPTVGVDPQSRRRILDTVLRLRDELGMSVLYTTHYMEEAQELSDRVGIIDHGEIIAEGTVGELIRQIGEEDRLVLHVGDQALPDGLAERLQAEVEGITGVHVERHTAEEALNPVTIITILAKRGRRALPDLLQVAADAGLDVDSVEVREPDLEAVFLHLTGRALRD